MATTPDDEVRDLLGETLAGDPRRRAGAVRALGAHLATPDPGEQLPDAWRQAGWDRVLELVDDPDAAVRRTVLHALAADAPAGRAGEVDLALARLGRDRDDGLARRARKVHARYRRDRAA